MFRLVLPLLLAIVWPRAVDGQVCWTVVSVDGRSLVAGCRVVGVDGSLLATTAQDGRFCLPPPLPESILLEAQGFRTHALRPLPPAGDTILLRSLRVDLPELRVLPAPDLSLSAAVMTATELDSALLHGFERSGPRSAMLWVPGVQMDARGHGGSMRLSIRGSLLRSPFGVRGVKVYWGAFPITLADGSTPLELLDPELMGTMRVVRSVGAPGHGSAPAGLLLAEPPLPSGEGAGLRASVSGGSYGFHRASATATLGGEAGALVVGLVHQRNQGYREQERTRRDQVFIASRQVFGRTVFRTQLTWQQAGWGLPGSLDSLTAATAPRSARPFSKLIDARLEKRQLMAGVAMEQAIGGYFRLMTTLHAQTIDKLNPYGTTPAFSGYKEETIRAGGSRVVLRWDRRAGLWSLSAEAGVEALAERDILEERVFAGAEPDTFRTRGDTRVDNLNGFAEFRLRHAGGTDLFLAMGMERTRYDHEDLLRGDRAVSARPASGYPVLGLSQRVLRNWRAGLRYGEAVSRPTVWELLGTAGRFGPDLAPERITEWEVALERGADTTAFQFQAAGYLRRTEGLILPFLEPDGTGEFFANAGAADQRGAEALLGWRLRRTAGGGLWALGTLTLQEHRLLPADGGARTAVPGVPGLMAGAIVRWHGGRGAVLEGGARHVGKLPVGPGASTDLPAFTVLHLRAERSFSLGRKGSLGLFVHVENLGDAAYTSFVQMNDPGGRYHNPAPGRSFFAGLNFRAGAR